MRKLLATTCILIAISVQTFAGDIPGTGKTEPPPPPPSTTSTTTTTTTTSTSSDLLLATILTLVGLIR